MTTSLPSRRRYLRYMVAGALAFALVLVAAAPASMIRYAAERIADVDVASITGTVWRGGADVYVQDHPAGRLTWQVHPLHLLLLTIVADWQLTGPSHHLSGSVERSLSAIDLTAAGMIGAGTVNAVLAPYDMHIAGDIAVDHVALTLREHPTSQSAGSSLESVSGTLNWQGGDVRYLLSGRAHAVRLPPLEGVLARTEDGRPAARVAEVAGEIPVLTAQLTEHGFVKLGVTKHFTNLLGTPWPGSDPDHAVVLEVEEQLL